MKLSQFPISLIEAVIGIADLSFSVALVIVETAGIDLSTGKSVYSLSKFFPIHDFSFEALSVFVGFFSFAMRQALGPCSIINIPRILILIVPFSFCVEVRYLPHIKAPFFENKDSFHWFKAGYLSLEDFSFGEVDGDFSFNLIVFQEPFDIDFLCIALIFDCQSPKALFQF